MQSISIIGAGRMGGALALALSASGYRIGEFVYRSSPNALAVADNISPPPRLVSASELTELSSDIVLICSQDTEIANIAERITGMVNPDAIVLHTSGSLSSSVLEPLRDARAQVGSIHPLISISDSFTGSRRFPGAYFCIEGDDRAAETARSIAQSLGGIPFSIDTEYKALYHASAVMAAGHVVALFDEAIEMLSLCGISKSRAQEVLYPLIRSTIENLGSRTPDEALTGTYARVDAEAFERHLTAFEDRVPDEIRDVYLMLADRSIALAEQRGADREAVEDLRSRISIAKRNREC